ncbi:MAG: AbrB/MazE/SpoVT family DNA-binding domain-containing protein [Nanoarchaeota archaeon]
MMEIKAMTRKWGNSIGILIPKEAVKREDIKPNQEITLMINKKPITKGKDIWGTLKFKESTEQLMREVDKEFGLD